MRACVLLLMVLVPAVLITETEAGWFRRALRKIKNHVRCRFEAGKIHCSYVVRGKRAADDGEAVNCMEGTFPEGEIPLTMLNDVFTFADADNSTGLNHAEYMDYAMALAGIEDCINSTQWNSK